MHGPQQRPRPERRHRPDQHGPAGDRCQVGPRPHAFQPAQDHLEAARRAAAQPRPASRESRDQPLRAGRRDGEGDEHAGGDGVEGEDHAGRVLQRGRHGNQDDQDGEDQDQADAVEDALDHDRRRGQPQPRRHRRVPLAPQPARHDVDAHQLTGAQGQDVIGHVADHVRRHQPRRVGARREEVAPANGARPQPERRDGGGRQHPPPVGGRELTAQLGEVDAAQEQGDQGHADGEARGEPQVLQRRRGLTPGRPPPGSSWWGSRRRACDRSWPAPSACRAPAPRASA